MSREAWLKPWRRIGDAVQIGESWYCVGCGCPIRMRPDDDFTSSWHPNLEPAWPFLEHDCPLCATRQLRLGLSDRLTARLLAMHERRQQREARQSPVGARGAGMSALPHCYGCDEPTPAAELQPCEASTAGRYCVRCRAILNWDDLEATVLRLAAQVARLDGVKQELLRLDRRVAVLEEPWSTMLA